jgi:TRAP-type C4-dicarboxylate transport system permease small subunit
LWRLGGRRRLSLRRLRDMKTLRLFDRIVEHASVALTRLAALAIVLMMVHVVIDVTGRWLFNHPLPGTLESVTYYYMVMVTALPFAYVTRSQGQIAVEMFTGWLAPRPLSLVELFAGLLTLIYVVAIAWKMGQEAIRMTEIGEVHDAGTMQLVTWPSRWLPPIALGVMACAVVLRMIEDFRTYRHR